MHIGITGSKGFIGSHVVAALSKKKGTIISHFNLPEGNLLNAEAVAKFVHGKDVVVHVAAVNRGTNAEVIAGTVTGTLNLVNALRAMKNPPKIIFLSSVQAETQTVYGMAKKLAEVVLEEYAKETGAQVSVLRLTNVFGSGCKPFYNSVVATFCYQVQRDEPLTIHNEAKRKLVNLVSVDEVVRLILRECKKEEGDAFFFERVASHNEITVGDLAELIQSFKTIKSAAKLDSKFEKDLYKTYRSYSIS